MTVTPAIQAAFVAGGLNTLSVATYNSFFGGQCFYGADIILEAGPAAPTVPLTNWGILFSFLIMAGFSIFFFRRNF